MSELECLMPIPEPRKGFQIVVKHFPGQGYAGEYEYRYVSDYGTVFLKNPLPHADADLKALALKIDALAKREFDAGRWLTEYPLADTEA